VLAVLAAAWWWRTRTDLVAPGPAPAAAYVNEAACGDCHAEQRAAWFTSHHAQAMQPATDATVAGDFDDATFTTPGGRPTRFSRRDGRFVVTTDGLDGVEADFDVRYTFGITPLQQYLLALPDGRLQALSVAWDTSRRRWFHLYPDERIDSRDALHWTKPAHTWNVMCADCHSTGVRKGYDRRSDRYGTQYSQVNVGCQACHGPGSAHVAWANQPAGAREPVATPAAMDLGLLVERAGNSRAEADACARCHARRSVIARDEPGGALMDAYVPALLDPPLYHADGQILDEVYVYGSFLQSRMHAKGVRCTSCHDPHSGTLAAEGNALCTRCHTLDAPAPAAAAGVDVTGLRSRTYDSAEHHFHAPGQPGSRCVDCHAPSTTYMVVDPRADHSFRVPRPDLGTSIGAPDACTRCHTDRSTRWAADVIRARNPGYAAPPHYGAALDAGRHGKPGAVEALTALVRDAGEPAIARATALGLLARYPGALSRSAALGALGDADPMVRRAAAGVLQQAPPEDRVAALAPLLADPVRAVRIEAARVLAPLPAIALGETRRAAFDRALAELEASYRINEDLPAGRLNLGNLFLDRGRLEDAEAELTAALDYQPVPVPAVVNLADLYRITNRDRDAEALLRRGLDEHPRDPHLTRALALTLVRLARAPEALTLLSSAASTSPELGYLYAVALAGENRIDEAIAVLEQALAGAGGHREILLALADFHGRRGDAARADAYLRQLAAVNPVDPALPRR
jgi:predicted CXXCH cytochrome family protein